MKDDLIKFQYLKTTYRALDCGLMINVVDNRKVTQAFAIFKNKAYSKIIKWVYISLKKYKKMDKEQLIRKFKRVLKY